MNDEALRRYVHFHPDGTVEIRGGVFKEGVVHGSLQMVTVMLLFLGVATVFWKTPFRTWASLHTADAVAGTAVVVLILALIFAFIVVAYTRVMSRTYVVLDRSWFEVHLHPTWTDRRVRSYDARDVYPGGYGRGRLPRSDGAPRPLPLLACPGSGAFLDGSSAPPRVRQGGRTLPLMNNLVLQLHHHTEKNHQGLGNDSLTPLPANSNAGGSIPCRARLGGILHGSYRGAA